MQATTTAACMSIIILVKYIVYVLCNVFMHKCDVPGCGTAMVFDRNLKNHRDVCCATSAGYAQFKGLSGQVRIGCQNTPEYKSRYCAIHKPTVATLTHEESEAQSTSGKLATEYQAGFITAKRVTRNSTLYQVIIIVHKEHNLDNVCSS